MLEAKIALLDEELIAARRMVLLMEAIRGVEDGSIRDSGEQVPRDG